MHSRAVTFGASWTLSLFEHTKMFDYLSYHTAAGFGDLE
jgi:hypothetical protein